MRPPSPAFARTCTAVTLGAGLALAAAPAQAGTRDLGSGMSLDYAANLTYSLAMRTDDADPELLANVNGDDGNRAFDKNALINNRLALLAEGTFRYRQYGLVARGSAFYDDVYFHDSDNDSQATLNRGGRSDRFSDDARDRLGARARMLDLYAFAAVPVGNTALDIRAGNQVVSWGESLYFPNTSGAQAPADATKSNVPGTEVKEILLPTGQLFMQWGATDRLSLMGYWQWQWKGTELNPSDAFFSSSDLVGPGAESLLIPAFGLALPRAADDKPGDDGQWGIGTRYRVGDATEISLHYLRYNDKNPVGANVLTAGGFPSGYQVVYTDDIKMTSASLSTELLGTAVGAEVSYRQDAGVNILVGSSPTPGRGDVIQGNFNLLKIFLPTRFWDTLVALGEVSYLHVTDTEALIVPTAGGPVAVDDLAGNHDAGALQWSLQAGYQQVWAGWDLTWILVNGYGLEGTSPIAGALGSFTGKGDIRYSFGPTFKYLGNLEVGLAYNGYAGGASLARRPLADRSNAAFSIKYSF
ncbi:DUF1302 domain-containing protein [Solimonas fluminis]|nr:DUF1302 family protein [Solimonas fluminis]